VSNFESVRRPRKRILDSRKTALQTGALAKAPRTAGGSAIASTSIPATSRTSTRPHPVEFSVRKSARRVQELPSYSSLPRVSVANTLIDEIRQAERASQLRSQFENEHFYIKRADKLLVRFLAGELRRGPLDLDSEIRKIAHPKLGKYGRAHRLLALISASCQEGRRLASTGAPLPGTPVKLKHVRLEVARMFDNYDKAVEFALSSQCSEIERIERT